MLLLPLEVGEPSELDKEPEGPGVGEPVSLAVPESVPVAAVGATPCAPSSAAAADTAMVAVTGDCESGGSSIGVESAGGDE